MPLGVDDARLRNVDDGSRDAPDASDFRELLELVPDAVTVLVGDGDSDRRVIDANTAACKLYGYSRDQLLGLRVSDLVEPEAAAWLRRELPSAPGRVHFAEARIRRSDGTLVPVEGSSKVLPDGRLLSSLRDISERKRAEREREELLSRIVAVVEQCPVALALVETDLRWEGNARMRQIREMLGIAHFTTVQELYDVVDRPGSVRTADGHPLSRVRSPSARALRGETIVGDEFQVPDVSGVMRWLSVSAGPIVGPEGAVLGAIVVWEDVTAPKELERLRAEWSSVVAHDLRQPLTTISFSAELTARGTDDPKLLKHVERVRAAASRLTRMVGDLMDLSRLEASRLELVRQRVDVPALVRAAAERAELETTDRPFTVRIHGEVPEAYADPDRIDQVLENLLTNAVKYGKAGTPIGMRVQRDGNEIAVWVTNEGRGLTPGELEHIFERFQRTASAKLEGIQGVGLGLYITRALVEAHGGRIRAESTPGGVTAFRFTLPVA